MQGGQVRPPNYTIAGESYAIVQRQRVADALREIAKQCGIIEVSEEHGYSETDDAKPKKE